MDSQQSLQLAKMRNSAQETRDYAFKMEAVKKNLMPPVDKAKKLRESCEGFESIFIQKMWEQMRATIPESGLLKGREERFWQSMYDQELAKTMTSAGGIGLADMMYEQLSQSLRNASKSAADVAAGQSSGFAEDLEPAPLVRASAEARGQAAGAPPQGQAAAGIVAGAPARQPAALAGLYSEAGQPEAPEATPAGNAVPGTSGAPGASAAITPDGDTDPAIVAVLNQLRAAHQAHSAMSGGAATGMALGARPPMPPMQGKGQGMTPERDPGDFISTLSKPVRKPSTSKRAILPRVPAGQPVNRNLPFTKQEAQQAQSAADASAAAVGGIGAAGAAFAARQKGARIIQDAALQGMAATGAPRIGG